MSDDFVLSAPRIFDGDKWHHNAALSVQNQRVKSILPLDELEPDVEVKHLTHGYIAPGFVDLQVNGGGGVLLNNEPTIAGIEKICAAHARFGTTALFPTLITDTNEVRDAAISAAIEARQKLVPGFAGLHLEGPHLSAARKGAHDPNLIRAMTEEDVATLIEAKTKIGALIVTLAPESVTPQQVSALAKSGVKISLGHSDASFARVDALIQAGAALFTHLFNAMSQMTGREPGMVGAALSSGYASIIADGHHVHPISIRNALRAKSQNKGNIFLISDAMSFTGTDAKELVLNGRKILRQGGKLTLQNGTLAGADIEMVSAVRYMHQNVELDMGEALRMATSYPATAAALSDQGHLRPGAPANFVWLSENIQARSTWISGQKI